MDDIDSQPELYNAEEALQALIQVIQKKQFELGKSFLSTSSIQFLAEKHKFLSKNLFTVNNAKQIKGEAQNPDPDVENLLNQISSESKQAHYIIENSKERRKFFITETVKAVKKFPNLFSGQQIYHFNAQSIAKDPSLGLEIQKKIIQKQVEVLKSSIENQGTAHSILFIDIPFHLQNEETCELLESMISQHKLHLIYLCQDSDFPVPEENKVNFQDPASLVMSFVPSYLQTFVQPVTSYFVKENQPPETKISDRQALLPLKLFKDRSHIRQLYPLKEEELTIILNRDINNPHYQRFKINGECSKIFATLSLKLNPATSIGEIRQQFNALSLSH